LKAQVTIDGMLRHLNATSRDPYPKGNVECAISEFFQISNDAELGRRFRELANNPKHHLGTLTLFAAECCKLIAEYDKEDRHEY